MSQLRVRSGRPVNHINRTTGAITPGIINSINGTGSDATVNLTLFVNSAAGTSLLSAVPIADIEFDAGPQSL